MTAQTTAEHPEGGPGGARLGGDQRGSGPAGGGPSGGGPADLVRLLLLLQAGFVLVAMLGEVVMMASPWYAVIPLADAILLLVLARGVARGHRRAMITTIVVQAVGLAGVALGMLAGLLPQVDHTVTLAGLVTDIAMPVLAIILCSRLLGSTPPLPAAGTSGSRAGTP